MQLHGEQFRTEGHHVYEYDAESNSYVHVYQNARLTGKALLNDYHEYMAYGCDE